MDENNFNDIVLEKNEKGEKLKKILLRVIALIILFLVVLIAMKLLKSDESTSGETLFPPEPSEIVVNKDDELDEFAKLKEQIQAEQNASEQNQSEAFVMPLPSSENNATAAISPEPKPEPKAVETKPTTPKAEKPKTEKPKTTPKAEKPKAEKPKAEQKPKTPSSTSSTSGLQKGIYVQIYSVSKFDAKSHEIKKITDNGYEYKSYKTQIQGKDATRVLVGPFSEGEIDSELAKIREKINKEAFKFVVK